VIEPPPSEEGGEKVTVAWPSLAETATFCGAEGTLIAEPDTKVAGPVPAALTAAIANVYTVPGVRLGIVIGLVEPVKTVVPLVLAGDIVTV